METATFIVLLLVQILCAFIGGYSVAVGSLLRFWRKNVSKETRRLLDEDFENSQVQIETRIELTDKILDFARPPFLGRKK